MAGVPHRSLGRKVLGKILHGLETWDSIENIPPDAIDEFRDGDDLETSLWDDSEHAQSRRDVILSLIFSKQSIGPFSVAFLWQDDASVGDDLGLRIVQSPGDTPYKPGRHLHYHVSSPTVGDASRLAFAAKNRNDIVHLTTDDVRDIIEDAYVEGLLPLEGLNPTMQREVQKLVKARFIDASTLHNEGCVRLFDVREPINITRKVASAVIISEHDIVAALHKMRIGNENVFTLYCNDGTESRRIARQLRRKGKKPRILIGGLVAWAEQGFHTDKC